MDKGGAFFHINYCSWGGAYIINDEIPSKNTKLEESFWWVYE